MTIRDLIKTREKLIERSKILEVLDIYLDTYLSKDDREAENSIELEDNKYVSEDSIREIRRSIYEIYEKETAKLIELEERELD
jgi:hypothetical protein